MCVSFKEWSGVLLPRRWNFLRLVALSLACSGGVHGQTASTSALTGVTLDPSGAVLPGVVLHPPRKTVLMRSPPHRTTLADSHSSCCPTGTYEVQASKADFKPVSQGDIHDRSGQQQRRDALNVKAAFHRGSPRPSAEISAKFHHCETK